MVADREQLREQDLDVANADHFDHERNPLPVKLAAELIPSLDGEANLTVCLGWFEVRRDSCDLTRLQPP